MSQSIHNRYTDLEELRPLGEASRAPDPQLTDHSSTDPRRQRSASVETGYFEQSTNDEAECRSCGVPIPVSQTKCRFCLTNHLGDMDASTTNTTQEPTLVGIVFTLVESSTFYGAVAKSAAAGNLLVVSETEESIDEYRLIYDLKEEPVPQLADRWPSLPDATKVTSAADEQLLTAIRQRMDWEDGSTPAGEYDSRICLYDESGSALLNGSRLDTILENASDPMWLVPVIALRETSEEEDRDGQSTAIPTKGQLECHRCDVEMN